MRKKETEYYMMNAANYKLWAKLTHLDENITLKQISQHLVSMFNKYKKNNLLPIKISWGLDQILLKKYCEKLPKNNIVILSNLDNYLLIDTEWKSLKAFYKDKKYNISKQEIIDNSENIIFFTRNEHKNVQLEEKISFLKNIILNNNL